MPTTSVHCTAAASTSAKGCGSSWPCGDTRLAAEAVDMSADGLGLAVLAPAPELPAVGERGHRALRGRRRGAAVVRHVGRVRSLPLLGLSLVPDT